MMHHLISDTIILQLWKHQSRIYNLAKTHLGSLLCAMNTPSNNQSLKLMATGVRVTLLHYYQGNKVTWGFLSMNQGVPGLMNHTRAVKATWSLSQGYHVTEMSWFDVNLHHFTHWLLGDFNGILRFFMESHHLKPIINSFIPTKW